MYTSTRMSQTPNYDVKVKTILDTLKPGERVCSMTGEKWMMTEEEIGWYKKFNVPPPKVSPLTRWKHHGAWYVGYQYWYQKHPETRLRSDGATDGQARELVGGVSRG